MGNGWTSPFLTILIRGCFGYQGLNICKIQSCNSKAGWMEHGDVWTHFSLGNALGFIIMQSIHGWLYQDGLLSNNQPICQPAFFDLTSPLISPKDGGAEFGGRVTYLINYKAVLGGGDCLT